MTAKRSLKMYLTIFVATTCIYMVLYQYHLSRQPITQAEFAKKKVNISPSDTDISSIARKYNSILWSPMSLFSARQPQEQQQQQQPLTQQSISERQSSNSTEQTGAASPLLSPLQAHQSFSNSTSSSSISSRSNRNSNKTLKLSSSSSSSSSNKTTNTIISSSSRGTSLNNMTVTEVETNRYGSSLYDDGHEKYVTQIKDKEVVDNSKESAAAQTTLALNRKITINGTTATTKSIATSRTTTLHSMQVTSIPLCPTTNPLPAPPPPLYIITPTYKRAEQLAELTRLGYTLKHVTNLLWLVIDDANHTSPLVIETLKRIGVPYEYFLAPMPDIYKRTKKAKPRGVSNRNRGLDYIRANATEGVVYFADDDNTYDISIFEQMRYTKKVSMWPVGLVTKFGVSTPIIRNGKITGFYDGWIGGRKYPIDMAGFAVSVKFLLERPTAKMPYKPGYEEDGFLRSLAPLNLTEIEPLASNCTEILTWHTQTKKNANATTLNMKTHGDTNLVKLDKYLIRT